MRWLRALLMAVAVMPASFLAHAQQRDQRPPPDPKVASMGAQVYQERCAMCHDSAQGNIPPRSVLRGRSPDFVLRVLKTGIMRPNATGLSNEQLAAVVVHVTGRQPGAARAYNPNANRCRRGPRPLNVDGPSWMGWGGQGVTNMRYQPEPGLAAADVSRLKLKWAFAYPDGVGGQPVIVGDCVFVTSAAGLVFMLDAVTGCTHWVQDLLVSTRTTVSVGKLPSGRFAVYVGDDRSEVHALNADTGRVLWHTRVDDHPTSRLRGSPTLFEGRLYVPVSAGEEALAADPTYTCCNFRGSIVALDAATGRILWKSYTIAQEPKPVATGSNRTAPAGAAVWSVPTIDAKRRLVYVATGNAYTAPVPPEANAVIAYDLDTGARRWVRQLLSNDAWLVGCDPKPHANCPEGELGPDYDLGAAPMLVTMANGKDILIASGKSGLAHGLDPQDGKIVWETQVGQGGTRGGIEWGGATDGERVYFPVSDTRQDVPFSSKLNATPAPVPGGVHALSVATGERTWHTPAPPPVCAWGMPCDSAQPGAATLIPGVVFAGSWDGHERAYAAADGRILWDFDTGRSFDGVNGAKANGGSVDGGSQTIAGGTLFVNSGVRFRVGNGVARLHGRRKIVRRRVAAAVAVSRRMP